MLACVTPAASVYADAAMPDLIATASAALASARTPEMRMGTACASAAATGERSSGAEARLCCLSVCPLASSGERGARARGGDC